MSPVATGSIPVVCFHHYYLDHWLPHNCRRMALVTIQFGQCGNQVGYELFSTLAKDIMAPKPGVSIQDNELYVQNSVKQWFDESSNEERLCARAILVDTEKKVVQDILQRRTSTSTWKYSQNMTVVRSGGAGNNWALGYQKKGPELLESVSEALRIQCEKLDRFSGVLSIMSSAGGTGSGVGSYITENIRDEYPKKVFLNTVILPFEEGEVVTQSYNTLLTLAKVWSVSDATLLMQNDHLHRMLLSLLNFKSVGISDLNSIIAMKMAGSLQPHQETLFSTKFSLSDMLSHIAPHPAYKFFSVKSSPHTPKESKKFEGGYQWHILTKHMKQMLRINSLSPDSTNVDWELKQPSSVPPSVHSLQQYSCSVANLLITRGIGFSHSLVKPCKDFQEKAMYPRWVPEAVAFSHCHEARRFHDQDKFAVLLTNNCQLYKPLNNVVDKAWRMFTHKAYLHQYSKFGLSEEEFVDAFIKIESVIKSL